MIWLKAAIIFATIAVACLHRRVAVAVAIVVAAPIAILALSNHVPVADAT